MNRIQSKDHDVETNRINKFSLFCYDNKRHILEDVYSTLSHLHKSTC